MTFWQDKLEAAQCFVGFDLEKGQSDRSMCSERKKKLKSLQRGRIRRDQSHNFSCWDQATAVIMSSLSERMTEEECAGDVFYPTGQEMTAALMEATTYTRCLAQLSELVDWAMCHLCLAYFLRTQSNNQ